MNRVVPLLELVEKIVDNRGRSCPRETGEVSLLTTNAIEDERLYPNFFEARSIDRRTYETWFRAHPLPGDILLVTKGSPGKVCLVPEGRELAIAQDMVALRPSLEKVHPPYLVAALRSKRTKAAIHRLLVGALIPHFKKSDFSRLSIPLFSPTEQRLIGDFYLRFSERVEAAYAVLESLKKIIFSKFSALGVRLVREGDGLRAGEREKKAADLFDVVRGLSYRSEDFDVVGTPLLTLGVFSKDGSFSLREARRYSGPCAERKRVEPGELVVVNTDITRAGGLLGMPFVIPRTAPSQTILSHHAYVVRPKVGGVLGVGVLRELFASREMRERMRKFAVGTTVRFVPKEALLDAKFVVPEGGAMLGEFEKFFDLVERRRAAIFDEISALENLRDTVTDSLFDGETKCSEVRRVFREAEIGNHGTSAGEWETRWRTTSAMSESRAGLVRSRVE